MSAISTPALGRSRRQRQDEPGTVEHAASEAVEAPVAAQDGDQGDGSALPGDGGGDQPQERRRRERQPKVIDTAVEVGDKVKVSVWLPAEIAWQLDHLVADTPGKTKGEVLTPWLAEKLKAFDYPKRPDWLLAVLERRRSRGATQEVSAN